MLENYIITCLMDWNSSPDYVERLNKVPNIIIDALIKIIEEHKLTVTDIAFDSIQVGSSGVGDAEIGGSMTAVDVSDPSKIYINCKSELSNIKRLMEWANKTIPDKVYKETELYMFDDYCEPIYTL